MWCGPNNNKKNHDLKRFSGPSGLSPLPPLFSINALGTSSTVIRPKLWYPHMDIQALKEFNRNKKLAKKYDGFAFRVDQVDPTKWGPGLKKAGQVPPLRTHNEDTEAKVDEEKSRIKLQMEMLGLAVAAGPVEMTDEELGHNIHLAVNFLVPLLKKNLGKCPGFIQ